MRDLIPEWIANFEGFQEMPLELSADIDRLLEEQPNNPNMKDILETREFLADRYNIMQDEVDKWKTAAASGSKVWLMSKEEQAGWNARVEAEKLERATKNASTECCDEIEEGCRKEELECENTRPQ